MGRRGRLWACAGGSSLELAKDRSAPRGRVPADGVAANIDFPFSRGRLRHPRYSKLGASTESVIRERVRLSRLGSARGIALEADRRPPRSAHRLAGRCDLVSGGARRSPILFDRYAVRRARLVLNGARAACPMHRPAARRDTTAGSPTCGASYTLWCWSPESPLNACPVFLDELRAGRLAPGLPPQARHSSASRASERAPFIRADRGGQRRARRVPPAARPVTHRHLESSRGDTSRPTIACAPACRRQVRHRGAPSPLAVVGGPYRERPVIARVGRNHVDCPPPSPVGTGEESRRPFRFPAARVQHDLRADRAPAGDFELEARRSFEQVHSCYGRTRQVQVLRDAILHCSPTTRHCARRTSSCSVRPNRPVRATGGKRASEPPPSDSIAIASAATPRLRYRITDRSCSIEPGPRGARLIAGFDLGAVHSLRRCSSRFAACGPQALRPRRRTPSRPIAGWIVATNVRWGLDGPSSGGVGLPLSSPPTRGGPRLTGCSWRRGERR